MPRSSRFALVGPWLLVLGAVAAFGLQLWLNQPVLGPLGLLLLAVPGYAVARTLGPRPLGWPEVLLVTLGAALALLVMVGTIAGLAPAGLSARSIAALEVTVLVTLAVALRGRTRRGELRPARPARRLALSSLLLAGVGLSLGAAGVAIATRAAQDQANPGFVQFWSVPPAGGSGATANIRNAFGVPIDCTVTIDRPGLDAVTLEAGTVVPGQTVAGALPAADPGETAPWRLSLECRDGTATPIERQLNIEPPR